MTCAVAALVAHAAGCGHDDDHSHDHGDDDSGLGNEDAGASWLDPNAWQTLASSTDPQAAHIDTGADACAPLTPAVEDGFLELTTNSCSGYWLGIPTKVAIAKGARITLVTLHDILTGPAGAQTHVRIDLDGIPIVDATIPMPAAAALDRWPVTVDRDVPAGSLLRVHLHNHGVNGWRIVSLRPAIAGE